MMLMLGYYGKAGGGGEGGLGPALGGVCEGSRVCPQVSVECKGGAQAASQEKLVDQGHSLRHQVWRDQAKSSD